MTDSPNLALVREIFKRVDEYRATSGSLSSVTLTVTEFDALRSALRAQPPGDWVMPKEKKDE